jgi:hypothetical protein
MLRVMPLSDQFGIIRLACGWIPAKKAANAIE